MADSPDLRCSYDFPYCGAKAVVVFVVGVTVKPRCAKHADRQPQQQKRNDDGCKAESESERAKQRPATGQTNDRTSVFGTVAAVFVCDFGIVCDFGRVRFHAPYVPRFPQFSSPPPSSPPLSGRGRRGRALDGRAPFGPRDGFMCT
jgi:hypothetical protein